MDKNVKGCCASHRVEILGVIMLAIATVLTLYTLSSAGIFGMFLVGVVFCTHKHFGSGMCGCGPTCGCCSTAMDCDVPQSIAHHVTHTPKKATTTRKKTKKVIQ